MLSLLRALFWIGLGILLWLGLTPTPPELPGLSSDPAKHAAGWAVMTVLSILAYPISRPFRFILILGLANLLTEVLQGLAQSGRSPEMLDWFWGMVGTVTVVSIWMFWTSRKDLSDLLRGNAVDGELSGKSRD